MENKKTEDKVAVKEVVKTAKPEIVIKDLVLPIGITVKEMKSCVAITNATGDKCWKKGRSLEISRDIPGLQDRTKYFNKNTIAKCHLGRSIGLINISDTKDLQNILKLFGKVEGLKKEVKEVKTAKKSVKKTPAKVTETPELIEHLETIAA